MLPGWARGQDRRGPVGRALKLGAAGVGKARAGCRPGAGPGPGPIVAGARRTRPARARALPGWAGAASGGKPDRKSVV